MIFRVWIKIFIIVFSLSAPLIWIQYLSQRESLEIAFDVSEKISLNSMLDEHLQLLKRVSKLDPEHSIEYKRQFEIALEHKLMKQDLELVKTSLIKNLLKDTFRNAFLVLGLFILLSFLISKNLVSTFQKLLDDLQQQSKRIERLNSIESWQKIARVLVHELRAPITPIKLLATDIGQKYETLDQVRFKYYLNVGAELIQNQISSIEDLLSNFTQFAKLPEIKRTESSIVNAVKDFVSHYQGYNHGQIEFNVIVDDLKKEVLLIDSKALTHLFFNLIKNASEANQESKIKISFHIHQNDQKTWIRIQNTGKAIPNEIADKIFDLHVSSKKGIENPNLGIGLTVARKIAMDHSGDLNLVSNLTDCVTFELELSNL